MSSPAPDLNHLADLIEAAKAEADRLGAAGAGVSRLLARAGAEARTALSREGRPDEGVRPEDLTTDNDR